jgi:polysaccharide export outer membrane protein
MVSEVIVKRSKIIDKLGCKVLLSVFFVVMTQVGWSQNSPPLPQTPQLDAAAATSPVPAVPNEIAPATEQTAVVLLIGAGDLLKMSILGAPESDQEVRVGADGSVPLNFVGPVHVAGLTIEQAQATIAKKLVAGGFYTDPQVSVLTKEYATQGVSVLGEVLKPGVYPLFGPRRLFDLLSLAGGISPKAGRRVSITHRDHPQTPRTVLLSSDAAESMQSNIEVFPGDTVMVSKADIVYVVGDVRKPTGVIMETGNAMTVIQAIAMAEGTNPNAALNKAKLIRKTPSGPQEIPLPLKDMLSAKSPDVHVQAEDIIFVPTSAAKSAAKRSLEAIIQMGTGLAIYRPY